MRFFTLRRRAERHGVPGGRAPLLADYVAAEDALRAFTSRNFGRMCAICARWTLLAAQVNAAAGVEARDGGRPVAWRLESVVTSCCNANHALESMSEDSLSGVVASREVGRAWWRQVDKAEGALCAALTEQGCALARGRPELCNRFFCEGVRDYLWALGGDQSGERLAIRLDDLQRRWTALYNVYQDAILSLPSDGEEATRLTNVQYRRQQQVRRQAGWDEFLKRLEALDSEIGKVARPVTADELAHRSFRVSGDRELYEPFFEREVASINGQIRAGE